MFPQVQELPDFAQGEAQALHLPDKTQSSDIVAAIQPESAGAARCFRKQGAALIEPDCVHGERRPFRHLSNLHRACNVI